MMRKVLELDPHDTDACFSLVESDAQLDSTSEFARTLIEMSNLRSLNAARRQALHYALGHLYERSQHSAEAIAHFHLANDLRRRTLRPPNLDQVRREVDARIQLLTRDRILTLAQYGSSDDSFVFIVGMPRSGTSLLEQILSSHSGASGLGERSDFALLRRTLSWNLKSKKSYPWCIESLTPIVVRTLSQSIAQQRHKDACAALRVVTKMPEDFWDIGLIAILFPRARFIHCQRDAVDTCLSCFMQNFQHIPYATSLNHLATIYRLYRRIMEHWRAVLPSQSGMLDVSYEEVLDQPEQNVRRLCEFCGLQFEDACLRFHETQRLVITTSRCQVRRPLNQASAGRWKRYREFLGALLELDPQAQPAEPQRNSRADKRPILRSCRRQETPGEGARGSWKED